MASIASSQTSSINGNRASSPSNVRTTYLRSVRTPLLLAIALSVVIPVVLVTVISSVVNISNATNRAYEQMETVSTLKASQIGFWVNLLADELNTIATDSEHLLLARQAEPNSAFPTLREPARADLEILYRQRLPETVQFNSLNLIAANGESIAGTDRVLPLFESIANPQQGEVYLFGPILNEGETIELSMSAWYPVFDGEQLLAFLGGSVEMTTLYDILQDETGTGESIETFLIDDAGNVIISGEPAFVDDNFEYVLGETTMTLPQSIAFNGTDVTRLTEFTSHTGDATFAVADNSLPLDTLLITEQPRSTVLNAAYLTVTVSVAVTFTAVLIVIVLGVFFIESRIVRPIRTLSTTANQIASGDLTQRASMNRMDELGELATSFNTMTGQLATSIDTLEERVEARTADLVVARDEAQRANHAKTAFLASTSHELRTPLNAVINYAKLISSGHWGQVTEQQLDALNTISKNGRYLLNLINDLLDMSKIAAGSLEIFKSDVNLNEEIEEVIKIGQGLIEDDAVELITDIEPDLPAMYADGVRIRQIMINMVSNACKFTEKGYIKLAATAAEGQFLFTVEDTGTGIRPEDKEAVFAAFQQTESGLLKGKGTGLGMSISQSLAEQHGGKLWFDSVYGKGTTFYLELPLNIPQPETSLVPDLENSAG